MHPANANKHSVSDNMCIYSCSIHIGWYSIGGKETRNRPGNISNKRRKPTRKAKKIIGGASAGQHIANQSPSFSVPYVEKIETPPNCKWSIPWNYDIRSMKYDRKLGKFWLRSLFVQRGPLFKINPWVEDNPREGHGIEVVPTGPPDGPFVAHYFRATCWNQGSVVRQEVETCFGVT